jgi:hypothetical protein
MPGDSASVITLKAPKPFVLRRVLGIELAEKSMSAGTQARSALNFKEGGSPQWVGPKAFHGKK